MNIMVINEIFYSIQGEGLLQGVPSVFVRIAGCPLRCTWCDTKYALDPNAGDNLTIPQIIDKIRQWDCKFIVITGGEPIVNPQLSGLASALKENNKHITIETSGIQFIPNLACDLMSISPKKVPPSGTAPDTFFFNEGLLSAISSHYNEEKKVPDTFFAVKQLIENYPYQLKFVVDSAGDLTEIQQFVKLLGEVDHSKILLMPQASSREELIAKAPMVAELCKQTGYAFCNRLQILLYDDRRGV